MVFSENFGTEGRGGYFDNYGIIRDIIQNHLLQILALFAMEPPTSLDAEDIRNEKVKVLRSMVPVQLDDVVLGQYKGRVEKNGNKLPAYLEDATVPQNSLCPTFAAVAMRISNARWDGVPFLLKAGKALDKRRAEIRVQVGTAGRGGRRGPWRAQGAGGGRWRAGGSTAGREGREGREGYNYVDEAVDASVWKGMEWQGQGCWLISGSGARMKVLHKEAVEVMPAGHMF